MITVTEAQKQMAAARRHSWQLTHQRYVPQVIDWDVQLDHLWVMLGLERPRRV